MRWLRKAFGRRFEPVPALEGDGAFALAVAGDGLYQAPLREVEAEMTMNSPETLAPLAIERACEALLVHEPDNPYDPGAMRVEILGRKVGYLRPDLAREILAREFSARDIPGRGRSARRAAARCRARVVRQPGETPDDVVLLRVRLDLRMPLAEEPAPVVLDTRRGALGRGAHREPAGEADGRGRQAGRRARA